MKKTSVIKYLLICLFIFTSCTTSKKIESDDDFAVDAGVTKKSDDLGGGSGSDLSLDDLDNKATSAKSDKKEAADVSSDSSLENELNSLGDSSSPKSGEQAKDELSLDEPAQKPVAQKAGQQNATATATEPSLTPAEPVAEVTPPPPQVVTSVAAPEQATGAIASPVETAAEAGKIATIENVTYQANSNGGTIAIAANQPLKFTTRLNSTTNQFIVEVENSTIPNKLKRSLNTKDMASSIGSVDIYQKAGSSVARFVVQLRPGSPDPIVQPEGNSLLIIGGGTAAAAAPSTTGAVTGAEAVTPGSVVAVTPGTPEVQANAVTAAPTSGAADNGTSAATQQDLNNSAIDGKSLGRPNDEIVDLAKPGIMSSDDLEEFLISNNKFYGKKISIETNRMDVKDAIKFIAEESGVNIILDETVIGNISLKLKSVPWDQALILILKSKKLGFKRQGSVLRIGMIADFKKEEQEAIDMKEARKVKTSTSVVKRFFIGYADITELEGKIKSFLEAIAKAQTTPVPTGLTGQAALFASLSAASKPKESVGTVISDKRTNSLIVTDTEENMVKISKLIEALDTQPQQVLIEGKVVEAKEQFTRGLGVTWSSLPSGGSTNTARIGISPNLDPGSVVLDSSLTWGQLDVLGSLTAKLSLGEREDKVRVLSSPRIAVLSNQQATISQTAGLLIPISTTSGTGTGTVQTQNQIVQVGVNLQVTPLVSNEGTVTLDLSITRSFLAQVDSQTPEERKAQTKVIVKSGQTAVIGGIFESETRNGNSGVPGLKNLPILGSLFQAEREGKSKNELVIFVTPTILKPVVGSEKKDSALQVQ